jgi:hypothetical protein
MTTMDFEMVYSHMVGANVYNPELVEMQNTGYQTAIRSIATYAYQNSDTPNTADDFDARTKTGGDSVAYVTTGEVGTDEDALRRHDGQLEFVTFEEIDSVQFEGVIGPGVETGAGTTSRQEHEVTAPGEAERIDVSASWGANAQDNELLLYDNEGNLLASSTNVTGPERITRSIEGGQTYVVVIETWVNAAAPYEINGVWERQTPSRDGSGGSTVTTDRSSATKTVDAGGVAVATHDVEADLHSFTVHLHARGALFETELVAPDGEVVRSFDPVGADRVGGKCCGHPEWDLSEPEPGTWTVRVKNVLEEPRAIEVRFGTLQSETRTPDPVEALGYEQREYDVTPFEFFEDYADSIADGGSFEGVTTREVARGELLRGNESAYDHVVVIHDAVNPPNGAREVDRDDYLSALDDYVDADGNLLLTDSGVRLLNGLDNELVGGLGSDHLEERVEDISHLGEKNLDHPLLTDVRPIQKALWKVAPLGYKTGGEAPMYLVDEAAFSDLADAETDSSVAATTGGGVSLGFVTRGNGTGVHVVGGLLPPAEQENLHPFGLLDYTTSFLGYLVFTSALGFTQERKLADGTGREFGRGDEWSDDGGDVVTGASREDDGSVFTASQTNTVEVAIQATEPVEFRDIVPIEWDVDTDYGDVHHVHDDEEAGVSHVLFSSHDEAKLDEEYEATYFVDAPEGPDATGSYEFGPLQVRTDGENWQDVEGTAATNYVLGVNL